jgi:hypothetical protein
MRITISFPKLLSYLYSVTYLISIVDNMWIKQQQARLFQVDRQFAGRVGARTPKPETIDQKPEFHFADLSSVRIIPVSVATQRCCASGAAKVARCATAR